MEDITSSDKKKKKRPHTGDVTQTPDTAFFCVSKICHSFILPQEQVKLLLPSPVSGIMPEWGNVSKKGYHGFMGGAVSEV